MVVKTLIKELKGFRVASVVTPLFMIGEVFMEMLIPLYMASIIDEGVGNGDIGAIWHYGAIMLVCALLGLIFGILGGVFGAIASGGFARNLRRAAFANIQTFSFRNIDKFSTSGLVTRLTTDITNIQNAYQMILRMLVRAPVSLVWAMVLSFRISADIARIYLYAVIFLAIVIAILMSMTAKLFTAVFRKYDDLNESVEENIAGIRVVKAYVREEHENSKFHKAAKKVYDAFVKAEMRMVVMMPVLQAVIYGCILLISWYGAHLIVVNSTLTTGELMSLLTYCMNILMSLMMVAMVFVMIVMSAASGRRVAEVLREEPDIRNPKNALTEVKDGSVEFKHVDFAYSNSAKEQVLKDINVSIKSGEVIGIIGGTGSAKTTLVNLISRLYDAGKGEVVVGGKNVKEYDIASLNKNVAVVLQKNVLFSGTILDNLRWGNPDATEEDCIKACKMACAHDFIQNFPDKYNTHIERGGTNVSGGQKQRLCIARALLKDPKVLILDDSTSAVDTATDARIKEQFRKSIPGVTKIIISQRISSIEGADRVIVMDGGRVNGFDTPANLLKTNAIYQEVYETQIGAGGDFDEAVAAPVKQAVSNQDTQKEDTERADVKALQTEVSESKDNGKSKEFPVEDSGSMEAQEENGKTKEQEVALNG